MKSEPIYPRLFIGKKISATGDVLQVPSRQNLHRQISCAMRTDLGFTSRVLAIGLYMILFAICFSPASIRAADGRLTKSISAGRFNSLVLQPDGSILASGRNQLGETGTGAPNNILETNSFLSNVVAISAGGYGANRTSGDTNFDLGSLRAHSLALKNDGTVWGWGDNQYGQLGTNVSGGATPIKAEGINSAIAIAAGGHHSLVLNANGTVYSFGRNTYGQLGDGSTSDHSSGVLPSIGNVVALAAGGTHSLLVKSDGSVWSFGRNNHGQLGRSASNFSHTPGQVGTIDHVVAVAAGAAHSLALKADGTVWSWGYNDSKILGNGSTATDSVTPAKVTGLSSIVAIAAGDYYSMALKADGTVWAWGLNANRNLGVGAIAFPLLASPVQVPGLTNIIEISAGGFHSLALDSKGGIWGFGYNAYGQVGTGDVSTNSGVALMQTTSLGSASLDVGMHSVVVRPDTFAWGFGYNGAGQVGQFNGDSSEPRRLSAMADVVNQSLSLSHVAFGYSHTLGIMPDGKLSAWGANSYGQLGDGGRVNHASPVTIAGLADVIQMAAGGQHSLAVLEDGSLWAWGGNLSGQLGDGSTTTRLTPVQISGASSVLGIAAGARHSVAVTGNRGVVTWGDNSFGQLGTNDFINRSTAFYVPFMANVKAVAAGAWHTMSLDLSGGVVAWGANQSGQIGKGNRDNQLTPLVVTGLPTIAAIGAGVDFSVALAADGRVYTWGGNKYGQLGLGTTTDALSPTEVPDLTNVQSIQVGDYHVIATLSDGSVVAWGANIAGQLGLRDYVNRLSPTSLSPFGNAQVAAQPYNPFFPNTGAKFQRFFRQANTDSAENQFYIMPLDFQKGVLLPKAVGEQGKLFGTSVPWIDKVIKSKRYLFHFGKWTDQNGIKHPFGYDDEIENPIVSFGSEQGGTPLFVGQDYHFGVSMGYRIKKGGGNYPQFTNVFKIITYARTNFTDGQYGIKPCCTNTISIPLPYDATHFKEIGPENNILFAQRGFRAASLITNGLKTDVFVYEERTKNFKNSDGSTDYGMNNRGEIQYIITHEASDAATNFYYAVEGFGAAAVGENDRWAYMVSKQKGAPIDQRANTTFGYAPLYALDFSKRPSWLPSFVGQPQLDREAIPPGYVGKTLDKLTNGPTTIDLTYDLSDPKYKALDASPELWRHEILDQFVSDMGKDPLALANFVFNEIELSDALAPGLPNVPEVSINCGAINRAAIGTFLERRGSPAEQCGLLVYLLRQAGYPAAYVYPKATSPSVCMMDTRLSKLLRMQIKGATKSDNLRNAVYTTDTVIPVNYPWVVTKIGDQTVHLFPWLKDTELVEGLNLYDYMPASLNSGYKWVYSYLMGNNGVVPPNAESNSPSLLFTKTIRDNLLKNHPGISVDDLGMRAFDRKNNYAQWPDFPVPDVVTNLSQVALVTDFATITDQIPGLTNYFNTIRVDVMGYDRGDQRKDLKLTTLNRNVCEMLNRKFIFTSTNGKDMFFYIGPYRTNYSPADFKKDVRFGPVPVPPSKWFDITLEIVYNYRKFADNGSTYPGLLPGAGPKGSAAISLTNTYTLNPGDLNAVCFEVGRVTKPMLEIYARQYWEIEQKKKEHPDFKPNVIDNAGTAAYLMGMNYFEQLTSFDEVNRKLHKVPGAFYTRFGAGIAKFTGTSDEDKVLPKVDMVVTGVQNLDNGTTHLDSGNFKDMAWDDYLWMAITDGSAQEHRIINQYFGQTNGVSTVRLLQLAQQRSNPQREGIIIITPANFNRFDYGTRGYDPDNVLQEVSDMYQPLLKLRTSDYFFAFLTPGDIANEDKSYSGNATLFLAKNPYSAGALISGLLHGGVGSYTPSFLTSPLHNYLNYSLSSSANSYYFQPNVSLTSSSSLNPVTFASFPSQLTTFNLWSFSATAFAPNPFQDWAAPFIRSDLQLPSSFGTTTAFYTAYDSGYFGQQSSFHESSGSWVADPVNTLTGEFYIDTTDLSLAGPMPLEIRRNYSSQNIADNEFGNGWKMNLMPFLSLSTNETTQLINITAAEQDGSVIVYQNTAANPKFFKPLTDLNPQLNNYASSGIGSTANLLNSSVTNYPGEGTNIMYVLNGADGSVRTFKVDAYPVTINDKDKQTKVVSRVRPYLQTWRDNCGNSYSFEYGTNAVAPDYGQVRRIQSSNGNFLGFDYDAYRHIMEAYSNNGRRLKYDYDDHGDLIKVTLPDNSEIQYVYEHKMGSTNEYSTHMMIQEIKPDGRALENVYDSKGRVVVQKATVGNDLNTYTNAVFTYSNNFTNNSTNTISGYTLIEDVNHRITRWDYTNSLITTNIDALGQKTVMDWYFPGDSSPGAYPRSLKRRTDTRGLISSYTYDSLGNVLTETLQGNLTGGTDNNETAVTSFTYTTNNQIATIVDPIGRRTDIYYTNALYPFLPTATVLTSPFGALISSVHNFYSDSTETVFGNTRSAYGMLTRTIKAIDTSDAATNDFAYNGSGFQIAQTNFTRTIAGESSDSDVITHWIYNNNGEMVAKSDAAHRTNRFDYDTRGNRKWKETYDQTGTMISAEYYYYNQNGEITWTDGPRYNPEDYVWRDYDGAGRVTQEIRWRSRAKADGSGVEAEVGDNLYSTTFKDYDKFNNLIRTTDQFGNFTQMDYDALGRLRVKKSYDGSAPNNPLTTESFGYEPGGEIAFHTNALGGVTGTSYTSTGKPIAKTNANGSILRWRYDLAGRVVKEVLPNGNYWTNVYLAKDAYFLVTRTFKKADETVLASNYRQFDYRGNLISETDAEGFTTSTTYDGLDRVKSSAGPGGTSSTAQQSYTMFYDASGSEKTKVNGLGETVATFYDALGREVETLVYENPVVRESHTGYSADNHSVTGSVGTGADTIRTVNFTDTLGNPVLTQYFPSSGVTNFTRKVYDVTGNLIAEVDEMGNTTSFTYDALHRLKTQTLPDGATTSFTNDAAGNLIGRGLPGGTLSWTATYDSAGRKLTEKNNESSRQYSYTYYSDTGLLHTRTDPRNVVHTYVYDDFLRVKSITSTGTGVQNYTTEYTYDKLGQVLTVTQTPTGATTPISVERSYDAYGQIIDERISLDGTDYQRDMIQKWDGAGRRIQLVRADGNKIATGPEFNFSYQADGNLASIGSAQFVYADNGLMQRVVRSDSELYISRDGLGRPISKVCDNMLYDVGREAFGERMSWRADSKLSSYTYFFNTYIDSESATGPEDNFLDQRTYTYNSRGQLTQETSQLFDGDWKRTSPNTPPVWTLTPGTKATQTYKRDFDQPGRLGVLSDVALTGTFAGEWSLGSQSGSPPGLDSLAQVRKETFQANNEFIRVSGTLNNFVGIPENLDHSTIEVAMDGKPPELANTFFFNRYDWWKDMDVTPGNHSVVATANAEGRNLSKTTNTFTLLGQQEITTSYDAAGNLTGRTFADGRVQVLTWDAEGRLIQMQQRNATNGGFNWSAVYDALGRRLQTTYFTVTNNVSMDDDQVIDSWYDSEVEFLEIGVAVNGVLTWKEYGPDGNGVYAGDQGVGTLHTAFRDGSSAPVGWDATDGTSFTFYNDIFGNTLDVPWFDSAHTPRRYSGYGFMAGFQPPLLGGTTTIKDATVWQGRRIDPTGFYWVGTRYYEPTSGRFISPDPMGHETSMSLYDYCGGDPINWRDADGRWGKQIENLAYNINSAREWAAADSVWKDPTWRYAERTWRYTDEVGVPGSQLSAVINQVPFVGGLKEYIERGYLGFDMITGQRVGPLTIESAIGITANVVGGLGMMSGIMSEAAQGARFSVGFESWQAQSHANSLAFRAAQINASKLNTSIMANAARGAASPTAASLSDLDFVQKIATKAESTGVRLGRGAAGTGSAQGTWKHDYAKRVLERYQRMTGQKLDLLAERSYATVNGVQIQVPYGTAGSSRPDVYNPVTGQLFDYKFVRNPGRGLGAAQRARNAANVPGLTGQWEINP